MGASVSILGQGQIGYAIARLFSGTGWDVAVAHRTDKADDDLLDAGSQFTTLDRNDDAAFRRWLSAGADLLVDTTAYTQLHARQLLSVQNHVASLCVISSASVYRDSEGRSLDEAGTTGFPDLPEQISEDQPTVAPGDQTYSTRKVAMERTLLDQANVPVTILRPCAIYGIKSRQPREWWFVKRILDGRRVVPLVFEGKSRFHTTATENIAALSRVANQKRFHGVLNVADPDALSASEMANAIAAAFDYGWEVKALDEASSQKSVGQHPWAVPRPFVLDMSKAIDLGYEPVTTYSEAAQSYCTWIADTGRNADWRKAFPGLPPYLSPDAFDYEMEDAYLGQLRFETPSQTGE